MSNCRGVKGGEDYPPRHRADQEAEKRLRVGGFGPLKKYYSRQKWTFLHRTRARAWIESRVGVGEEKREGSWGECTQESQRGLAVDGGNPL